jgi:pentatricopeptide repeat protein
VIDSSRSTDLRDQLQRALGDAYSLERELGGGGMSRVFTATEHGLLAYAYARAGNSAKARDVLDRMRSANGGRLPAMAIVAATMELLGDREGAVALLADAIAKHDPWIFILLRAERFDRLRRDPKAAAMLEKLGSW